MALTSTEEAQLRALIAQQAALLSLAGNETTITSKLSATKVNLSGIAAASALADTDLTLVRQGANDKSSSLTVFKSWITGSMASIATASGFASSLVASGYIKFPSWLGSWIVQWGTATSSTSGSSSSFPIAFPSSMLGISAIAVGAAASSVVVSAVSNTASSIVFTSSSGSPSVRYISVGN